MATTQQLGKLVDGERTLVVLTTGGWTGPQARLAEALSPASSWAPSAGHPVGLLYQLRRRWAAETADPSLHRRYTVVVAPAVAADLAAVRPPAGVLF